MLESSIARHQDLVWLVSQTVALSLIEKVTYGYLWYVPTVAPTQKPVDDGPLYSQHPKGVAATNM